MKKKNNNTNANAPIVTLNFTGPNAFSVTLKSIDTTKPFTAKEAREAKKTVRQSAKANINAVNKAAREAKKNIAKLKKDKLRDITIARINTVAANIDAAAAAMKTKADAAMKNATNNISEDDYIDTEYTEA